MCSRDAMTCRYWRLWSRKAVSIRLLFWRDEMAYPMDGSTAKMEHADASPPIHPGHRTHFRHPLPPARYQLPRKIFVRQIFSPRSEIAHIAFFAPEETRRFSA